MQLSAYSQLGERVRRGRAGEREILPLQCHRKMGPSLGKLSLYLTVLFASTFPRVGEREKERRREGERRNDRGLCKQEVTPTVGRPHA